MIIFNCISISGGDNLFKCQFKCNPKSVLTDCRFVANIGFSIPNITYMSGDDIIFLFINQPLLQMFDRCRAPQSSLWVNVSIWILHISIIFVCIRIMKGWLRSITRPRVDNRNELVLARFPGGREPWPRRGARSWSPAQQLLQSAGSEGKLTALEFISGNLSPNYFQFFTTGCRQWSCASLCKL